MDSDVSAELILIRHGATARPGDLCGRTDVPLAEGAVAGVSLAPPVAHVRVSPAKRAVQTAQAFWPNTDFQTDDRLWEQDFGAWDGVAFADLPDIGELARDELATFAAPGGESFADMHARVSPAITEASLLAFDNGPVAVVAHAGVVRVALAMALGDVAQGLAFEVSHLSVTRFRCLAGGGLAIRSVNAAGL